MKKQGMRVLVAALALCAATLVAPGVSEAATIEFDVLNHPSFGTNPTAFDAQDIGLRLLGTYDFHFNDVHFTVDTTTGFATMTGSMTHLASNQPWTLSATFNGIRDNGAWNPQPVPYDDMFEDLADAGVNSANRLIWGTSATYGTTSQSTLEIQTSVINPAYTGPQKFIGRGDNNGEPFYVRFRELLSQANFPGATWDLLGGSGYWSSLYYDSYKKKWKTKGKLDGEFHFVFDGEEPPVVPEPATSLLMSIGLIGSLARRKLGWLVTNV